MTESYQAKIIPRIMGGLGNQLFSYAAARRLALMNDAELVIDDVSGFKFDHLYQRFYQLDHFEIPCRKATPLERLEPFSRVRRYLKRQSNQLLSFEKRSYIRQEFIDYDPRLLRIKPRGTLYLEGYWQSERYFKDIEATLRSDLRIKPPADEANFAMTKRIRRELAVAVHVRFFDLLGNRDINNASKDYYNKAVKEIEKRVGSSAHYFVFSDRSESAKTYIAFLDDRVTYVSNNQGDANAYADLWLMTQCQHFIIANSTFSWWGAWLGGDADKIVIAPGFELHEGVAWWGFDGLIPEEWIKC